MTQPRHEVSSVSNKLTSDQRRSFFVSWLGWTLDAFDFFLLINCLSDIEATFGVSRLMGTLLITATLFMRPIGALLFGVLADKIGRKIPLILVVLCYSTTSFASAFAPNYIVFFLLRLAFGIGMGGEWGLGTAMTMEKVPKNRKGLYSGLLQGGYAFGYLCSTLVYFALHTVMGLNWRYIFITSLIPAILSIFVFLKVEESPEWEQSRENMIHTNTSARQVFFSKHIFTRFIFLIILMFAFTSLSHGTQDLYPRFLTTNDHHGAGLDSYTADLIAIVYNIAAVIGAAFFGALSDRIGQKSSIIVTCVLVIPVIPLFCFSTSAAMLCLGAAMIQFLTQGAWANVPALLSDLSPVEIRGFYPGVTYQLGLVLSGGNLLLQERIAARCGYPISFALVVSCAVFLVLILTNFMKPESTEDSSIRLATLPD